jgi:chorismate synthase
MPIAKIREGIKTSTVRCLDPELSARMCTVIDDAKLKGDSVGGVIQIIAENVPAGLGSYVHFDRKLDGKLAAALMSVQSVKGIHFGDAVFSATNFGSAVHDQITFDATGFTRRTNHYGGFEGGMTNGMPLVMQAYVKPIPTLYQPLDSVHLDSKQTEASMIERSDICVVPAASVVLEAVTATELAKEILEMFKADQISKLQRDFQAFREEVSAF